MSQNLQKGFTFSGTSPNNSVTASALNSMVDGATILTGFLTEKAEKTSAASGDFALLYDPIANAYRKIQIGNLIFAAAGIRGFNTLLADSTSNSTITVSAEEVLLLSATGQTRYIQSFADICDVSSYGGVPTPGGRDSSNEDNDAWYYFFAISNGTNNRLIFSTDRNNPHLPTGYTYKCRLGTVRNDHSGNFVPFSQRGREVAVDIPSLPGVTSSNLNPRTGASSVDFTDAAIDVPSTLQTVDLTRCVPPGICARVRGILGSTSTAAGTFLYALASEGTSAIATAKTETLRGLQLFRATTTTATLLGFTNAINFDVPIVTDQQISWTANQTTAKQNMRVTGYQLNL